MTTIKTSEFVKRERVSKRELQPFYRPFERPCGPCSQWYKKKDGHFHFYKKSVPETLMKDLNSISTELKVNFHISLIEGWEFNCAEKFMMLGKVLLFDLAKLRYFKVLTDPKEIKDFGRYKIDNYDDKVWFKVSLLWVTIGNWLKFSQNPLLKSMLKKTGDKFLVEASPYDPIWGIGIPASSPLLYTPKLWSMADKNKGKDPLNKLGEALMIVRSLL